MPPSWEVREGDALERLREMPAESVQTCVTSPPYWGLRDYGTGLWEGGDLDCDHKASNYDRGERADRGNIMERTTPMRDRCTRCGATRTDSQLGLEPTPELYVANMVEVFREVRRVLRDDGTLWLNLGDSYAGGGGASGPNTGLAALSDRHAPRANPRNPNRDDRGEVPRPRRDRAGLKPKDLVGIPWMVAFALRADGWYLRSDIIWAKPNPMPESVTDRPTKAHEYLFLLSKSPRYYWDGDAIREPHEGPMAERRAKLGQERRGPKTGALGLSDSAFSAEPNPNGRNKRSVWTVTTQPFPGAHFATFPPKLIEPCILAGAPEKCCGECGAPWERVVERTPAEVLSTGGQYDRGGRGRDAERSMLVGASSKTLGWEPGCTCHTHEPESSTPLVLDPFAGAGTTGLVALRHNRSFVGIELNPEYAELSRRRIRDDAPIFNVASEAA